MGKNSKATAAEAVEKIWTTNISAYLTNERKELTLFESESHSIQSFGPSLNIYSWVRSTENTRKYITHIDSLPTTADCSGNMELCTHISRS